MPIAEQYPWLDLFVPKLPHAWEFIILLLFCIQIIWAGSIIKRHWTGENDSLTLPAAITMWLGAFAVNLTIAVAFYVYVPVDRKTTVLLWCFFFWIPPVSYYSWIVVNSLAHRTVDRIGPFSAQIPDPSEFAAARKLALRGDIDGAVAAYRLYPDNQAGALMEAARLLKSDDRFVEAALMYEEIIERFRIQTMIWAEAMYQLAKLQEACLGEPEAAMASLRQILQRAPETRYGQLAGAEVARLQVLNKDFMKELVEADPAKPVADPFYGNKKLRDRAEQLLKGQKDAAPDDDDAPVPPADPFFKPAPAAMAAGTDGAGSGTDGVDTHKRAKPKSSARKRKPVKDTD